jgi:hypothetical protein
MEYPPLGVSNEDRTEGQARPCLARCGAVELLAADVAIDEERRRSATTAASSSKGSAAVRAIVTF